MVIISKKGLASDGLFRMATLEESKYDYETKFDTQKYDLKFMRQRVNDLMGKKSVAKKVNIRK